MPGIYLKHRDDIDGEVEFALLRECTGGAFGGGIPCRYCGAAGCRRAAVQFIATPALGERSASLSFECLRRQSRWHGVLCRTDRRRDVGPH